MSPSRIRDRLRRFRRPHLPHRPRTQVLPSLYDRHPRAASALRRARGVQVVPLDRIVGTVRHPTQNTADFLPLPTLRGKNWEARWQRIERATRQLSTLPPVDLVKVGDEYYVADGHNRVAAALRAGAVAIDADVVELLIPGVESSTRAGHDHAPAKSLLVGADEVRNAAAGQLSRTAGYRSRLDELSRQDLTAEPEHAADGEDRE
ncbi:MAG TPA: hypothetical protein VFH63_07150 [candidate division Zixibacteria bacterium]|nr:hypothetical protein [candidate division Zixibacteria bacterium]